MNARRILGLYRWSFVTLIVVASAQALLLGHEGGHDIRPLAAAELAGALLLISRGTQRVGALLLLCVFAAAQVISVAQGYWPTQFLQYACSVGCIVMLDRALSAHG
jgi:hypothetical protein